jgi:ribosomal protein L15
VIYLFLGVYGIFTLFILTMVIFEVRAIIPTGTVFHEPLYVMIVWIDFILILVVVMTRIFYGTTFNSNFLKQRDHLLNVHGILEDLEQLQDLYFRHSEQIENVTYRSIIEKIREKAEITVRRREKENFEEGATPLYLKTPRYGVEKVRSSLSPTFVKDAPLIEINKAASNPSRQENFDEDATPIHLKTPRYGVEIVKNSSSPTFVKGGDPPLIEINKAASNHYRQSLQKDDFEAKVQAEITNKISKAKESIEKVLDQVKFDKHHYSHKFLGKFESNFEQNISQILAISIPIIPPLINKLTGNENNILPNI